MNIIFFGSGHYAPIVLDSIIKQTDLKVTLVVTGDTSQDSPAHFTAKAAVENKLPLYSWTHEDQNPELIEKIKQLETDYIVVADFGHRKQPIPAELLALPRFGAVNIHPSLLPKYRGTTPVQTAIINGDSQTGVSLILMDDKFDHGPLIAQATIPLEPTATAPEIYAMLFLTGAVLSEQFFARFRTLQQRRVAKKWTPERTNPREVPTIFYFPPQPQDDTKATYTKMLKKEMGRIDWTKTPLEIERMIRAYSGWPGSWTTLGELFHGFTVPLLGTGGHEAMKQWSNEKRGKLVKIVKTHLSDNRQLVIDQLQIESKKPISWDEFGRGYLR